MNAATALLRRIGAFLIDFSLIGLVNGPLQPVLMILYLLAAPRHDPTGTIHAGYNLLLGCALMAIPVLFGLAYFVVFHACSRGATPGKMLLGLQVTTEDGRRLGLRRSTLRTFASLLCFASLGLGYVLMLTDRRHRAVHDRLAGTRVIVSSSELAPAGSLELTPWTAAAVLVAVVPVILSFVTPLCVAIGQLQ
jgi:uncharacterized RDD family membrane protein YckC